MTDTTERPLVTFAVIAFNQERFIREAVEGAFAQTYQPLEIILSDDCSPDGTFKIMQEMAAAYDGPHRVVLNQNASNLGLIPHIDRVMELVSGDFVVVNAGDDVSVPQRTEKLANVWESSGRRVSLVHSPALVIDESGGVVGRRTSPEEVLDRPSPYTIAYGCHYILGATLSWDRAVFDRFGPLGSGLSAEDIIIPFRAALIGNIAYVEEELVKYRVGGISSIPTQQFTPYDYMYGISHRLRKWRSETDVYILSRFPDLDYPGKHEAEAVCRNRAALLGFPVALAEAPILRRWRLGARAIWLSWRYRQLDSLKHWTMYALEPLYLQYAKAKTVAYTLIRSARR